MSKIFLKNLEKLSKYNINPQYYKGRKRGISAMMRVGDEEDFIEPSIRSVLDFFDEIIVVLNNPRDKTEEIVRSIKSDKIKIFHYPFELYPNGPGHDKYPKDSVKEISYYYNWCLQHTTFSHVCKWDGDMVALSNFKRLRKTVLNNDIVYFEGLNIAGPDLNRLSKEKPIAASEPRFFKVTKNTYYIQGHSCEVFYFSNVSKKHVVKKPVYLHYKHSKSILGATKVWPKDWRKNRHFVKIYNRNKEGPKYKGEQPKEILDKLKK